MSSPTTVLLTGAAAVAAYANDNALVASARDHLLTLSDRMLEQGYADVNMADPRLASTIISYDPGRRVLRAAGIEIDGDAADSCFWFQPEEARFDIGARSVIVIRSARRAA